MSVLQRQCERQFDGLISSASGAIRVQCERLRASVSRSYSASGGLRVAVWLF